MVVNITGMNAHLLIVLAVLAAEPQEKRLEVGASWAQDSGSIQSQDDGVLHGLQVHFGPEKTLREYAVFNRGQLEQRFQFYPDGETFRFQYRHHDGSGDDVIYSRERTEVVSEKVIVDRGGDIGPIKVQKVLAQGKVKNDQRWDGTFLVTVLDGFEDKLILQEYRGGKLVKSTPTNIDPPCELPGWPK